MINIKNFDPSNTKLDGKSYKSILIYFIGYVLIKDWKYVKIYRVNRLYGYFEKINGRNYLALVNEGKKIFKKLRRTVD